MMDTDRIEALEKRVAELERRISGLTFPPPDSVPYVPTYPLYPLPNSAGDVPCAIRGGHHYGLMCPRMTPMCNHPTP